MDKTIYFIRHGETEYNKLGIVQGSGVDSELNNTGKQQAEAFYNFYKNENFELIIASALQRTHQTIAPFLQNVSVPFEKTPLINEINWGIHEGQKYQPGMRDSYREMIQQWSIGNFDASLEKGESARSLSGRLQTFLEQLVIRPEKRILVCTHGRTLRCMMCLVTGQHLRAMESYKHHNTGLYKAHFQSGQFSVELENDIRHLEAFRMI